MSNRFGEDAVTMAATKYFLNNFNPLHKDIFDSVLLDARFLKMDLTQCGELVKHFAPKDKQRKQDLMKLKKLIAVNKDS